MPLDQISFLQRVSVAYLLHLTMASDEADDGKRRTSPHSSNGSQQQRRLFAILFALSATVTISLLFFFYHIRIKIKPSGKLDAEQKDDERGHGFEIWEILLTSCVPLLTWRFRWHLSRMLQRCFVAMQQQQQRRKSSMIIIIMATLLCLAIMHTSYTDHHSAILVEEIRG